MKRLIQSDLTKILIFFILTLISAAVVSPWLYNMGKFVAEVGESRNLNVVMNWLAQKCAHAEFPRYFNRALVICALVLAGPFIMWMRLGKDTRQPRPSPWRIKLPKHCTAHDPGQALTRNPHAFLHLVTGFLLTGSLLTLMVWLLLMTGWFSLQHPIDWWLVTRESLGSAVFSAIIEEWIFRGIILGIFLRAMRPAPAIVIVSLFYASIHFLLPPVGVKVINPGDADAGFRMVALVARRFLSPQDFSLGFISLLVVGLILAYARYRTASLWLPIGLHIGWGYVHRIFQIITELSGDHLASAEVIIGADRKSGLLPLSLLIATGLLVHVFVQISEEKRKLRT
ncbi:MAG: CPBP family intramembrane metalloprotease [Akkermansiaceae bacterium]|nr:CPBP family intramembrane metalloprotease [Akkermansiaceae bacterium]